MKHTTSTDLRKSLSAMMDRVNEDHEPVLVTHAQRAADYLHGLQPVIDEDDEAAA